MERTGMFQIQGSHKIANRGLVAFGQLAEGKAKIGFYLTFQINGDSVCLKIGGVEIPQVFPQAGEIAPPCRGDNVVGIEAGAVSGGEPALNEGG